jgi:hypothetical protein
MLHALKKAVSSATGKDDKSGNTCEIVVRVPLSDRARFRALFFPSKVPE